MAAMKQIVDILKGSEYFLYTLYINEKSYQVKKTVIEHFNFNHT